MLFSVLRRGAWLAFRYMQRQTGRRNRFRAKVNNRYVESIAPGWTMSPRRSRTANTTSREGAAGSGSTQRPGEPSRRHSEHPLEHAREVEFDPRTPCPPLLASPSCPADGACRPRRSSATTSGIDTDSDDRTAGRDDRDRRHRLHTPSRPARSSPGRPIDPRCTCLHRVYVANACGSAEPGGQPSPPLSIGGAGESGRQSAA